MLRFDKAVVFSPILKSNFLVSFNIKTCTLDVLLFSELINIVSTLDVAFATSVRYTLIWEQFHCIDLIMLLYTFLVICFDWYKK